MSRQSSAVSRTRSEYRLSLVPEVPVRREIDASRIRHPTTDDRQSAAELLLDAYRGTVDDEGETEKEALAAIDYYFATMEPHASFVLPGDEGLTSMSFVVTVQGLRYIDPVATRRSHKGRGLGRCMVCASLTALRASGATEVGAVITDGNTPSERLFASLGFERHGTWR